MNRRLNYKLGEGTKRLLIWKNFEPQSHRGREEHGG
jgi:hypothetical protein